MERKDLLLQFIKANGGRIHRGALHQSMRELVNQGLVKAEFLDPKRKPTEYGYVLVEQPQAPKGQLAMEFDKDTK